MLLRVLSRGTKRRIVQLAAYALLENSADTTDVKNAELRYSTAEEEFEGFGYVRVSRAMRERAAEIGARETEKWPRTAKGGLRAVIQINIRVRKRSRREKWSEADACKRHLTRLSFVLSVSLVPFVPQFSPRVCRSVSRCFLFSAPLSLSIHVSVLSRDFALYTCSCTRSAGKIRRCKMLSTVRNQIM